MGDKQKWTNGDTCDIYMVGTDVISGSSPEQSADESCTIGKLVVVAIPISKL